MTGTQFVVLGLAKARSTWFRDLGRWATSAAIPCEFVKCVSASELRARLESGRPFSAVAIDGSLPSLDRDLIDTARTVGCPVIAIDDGRSPSRDWTALGVSAVLAEPVGRDDFMSVLNDIARPLDRFDMAPTCTNPTSSDTGWISPVIAVTGSGGSGTSTTAMALADGLAADTRRGGHVLLADFALNADQAMIHDVGDVFPGLQELVEAFRAGKPASDEIRAITHRVNGRNYNLLTGLRHHRDWVAIRPRAFLTAFNALRNNFTTIVADIDADFEGIEECGSADVEDRNLLSRTTVANADIVVVTGHATTLGLHRQVRVITDLLLQGVAAPRILPVIIHAPRQGLRRLQFAHAIADLTAPIPGGPLPTSPIFIPSRRKTDREIHDGIRPHKSFVQTITSAVEALLARVDPVIPIDENNPVPVAIGSLGSWSTEELTG